MLLHFLMIHEDHEETTINHIGRKKNVVLMDGDNKGVNTAMQCTQKIPLLICSRRYAAFSDSFW